MMSLSKLSWCLDAHQSIDIASKHSFIRSALRQFQHKESLRLSQGIIEFVPTGQYFSTITNHTVPGNCVADGRKKKNSTRVLKHRSSIASGEKKLTLPLTMTSHWVALALGPFTGGKLRPRRHGRLQSLNETIWTAVPSQLLAHGKTALNNVVVNAWRNTTP